MYEQFGRRRDQEDITANKVNDAGRRKPLIIIGLYVLRYVSQKNRRRVSN